MDFSNRYMFQEGTLHRRSKSRVFGTGVRISGTDWMLLDRQGFEG